MATTENRGRCIERSHTNRKATTFLKPKPHRGKTKSPDERFPSISKGKRRRFDFERRRLRRQFDYI